MARQINRDSVKRVYMARITGTSSVTGAPFLREFGPYFTRGMAKTQATRASRRRPYGVEGLAVEVISAPVGEWTEEP